MLWRAFGIDVVVRLWLVSQALVVAAGLFVSNEFYDRGNHQHPISYHRVCPVDHYFGFKTTTISSSIDLAQGPLPSSVDTPLPEVTSALHAPKVPQEIEPLCGQTRRQHQSMSEKLM